jgi:hypothetical protein
VITIPQFAAALRGVRLMAKFDPRAWTCFDKTPAGFWASFVIAFALSPLNLGHVLLQFQNHPPKLDIIPYLVVEFLAYVLQWTLFPFVMLYVAGLLQRRGRYFDYMLAYNWLQLPLTLFFLTLRIVGDFHIIAPQGVGVMELAGLAVFFVYGTYVAGVGLQVGIGTALSLVVLDFVVSLITSQLIYRIEV